MSVEVYNPPGYESNSASFSINSANSTVTLVSSLTPSTLGQTATFTAKVTNTLGGSAPSRAPRSPRDAVPNGTMTFKDNGNNITGCITFGLNGAAQAICRTTLAGGSHTITAQYSGDANLNSASGTLTQQMNYLILFPIIRK